MPTWEFSFDLVPAPASRWAAVRNPGQQVDDPDPELFHALFLATGFLLRLGIRLALGQRSNAVECFFHQHAMFF
jgi:hypothetical protein